MADPRFILALDAGTTSVRAILFDHDGLPQGTAQREIRQFYPQPGWVEHDPLEIASAQREVAVDVLNQQRLRPSDIAAIGITNQRETTILWDRATGEPLHRAIVWQDRRTAGRCDELRAAGHDVLLAERTGLVLDAYFSATKLAWLLDHVPGGRARAEAGELAFGTVDTWLLWQLTGGLHRTDASNAARTMLYNLHTGAWDLGLLELFNIPPSLLPEIRPSSEVHGAVSAEPGLHGIPVAGLAGDQQAALFGQMCVQRGLVKCTYGTGCFLLQHTGTTPVVSTNRLLTTVAWQIGERRDFALEGSVFIGGAVVQWLRDGLKLVRSAPELDALAATVPDSAGVILVPAFAGLGAPHWDPYARGAIVGLTRDTTAAHLARAALEGIAFQVADLLDAMRADTGTAPSQLRVDGGACRSEPLMQFQADLLGVPVVRPAVTETTALGAAYFAGLAVEFWESVDSLASQWQIERTFEPRMEAADVAERRECWSRAVSRAKGWEQ